MQPSKVTPSPDSRLSDDEQRNSVRDELAELPEPTRSAIVLHHCSGLGFSEVAKILGVPEGTAKIRVHRGLAILRQRLIRKGMMCSLLVTANHLENLSAGEMTCLPFTSTPAAQQFLFDTTYSTITHAHPRNFIMKTLTMPTLATAAAAVVFAACLGFLLGSQKSAANDALTPSHASSQPQITPTVTSPILISDSDLNVATNETSHQTSPFPKHEDPSLNPDQVFLKIYDVGDFLSDLHSDDQKLTEKDISDVITQAVSPGSWDNVSCGITIRSGTLFISHRPDTHAQIEAFFAALRATKVESTDTPNDEQEPNAPIEAL
jgi:hypothetical protein